MSTPSRFASPLLTWHWLAAFALLLCNDHVLKGSPWVSAALTGKLSDVVGLYLAPPLLALLLRSWIRLLLGKDATSSRSLLVGSAALIGLGFTLLKLSPEFARTVEAAIRLLGLPSRIAQDRTDLWTLPLLLLSTLVFWPYFAATRAERETPGPATPRAQRAMSPAASRLHRVAVIVGALGSAATTSTQEPQAQPQTYWSNAPAVVNSSSDQSVTLRVHALRGDLRVDCAGLAEDPSHVFPRDAFGPLQRVQLGPLQSFDLGFWNNGNDSRACVAALIQLEGSAPKLVFWTPRSPRVFFLTWEEVPNDDTDTLLITFDGESTTGFSDQNSDGASKGFLFDYAPRSEARECGAGQRSTELWAVAGQGVGSYHVTRRSALPDGCIRLELSWAIEPLRLSNEKTGGVRVAVAGLTDAGPPIEMDAGSNASASADAGVDTAGDDAGNAVIDAGSNADGSTPALDAGAEYPEDASDRDASDGASAVDVPAAPDPSPGVQTELVLCLPAEAVPFQVGSRLDIDTLSKVALSLSIPDTRTELRVFTSNATTLDAHPFDFFVVAGKDECPFVTEEDPPRTSRPAQLMVNGPWGTSTLDSGESRTFEAGSLQYVVGATAASWVILSEGDGAVTGPTVFTGLPVTPGPTVTTGPAAASTRPPVAPVPTVSSASAAPAEPPTTFSGFVTILEQSP